MIGRHAGFPGIVNLGSVGIQLVAGGQLTSLATFASNASRTYFDQHGLLKSVGANLPRTSWIGGAPYFWADPAVTEISGRSYDLTNWPLGDAVAVKNAVGMDGEEDSAFTVTDSADDAVEAIGVSTAITSGTLTRFNIVGVKKKSVLDVAPRLRLVLTGGTDRARSIVVNPVTGAITNSETDSGAVIFGPVSEGDFWLYGYSVLDNSSGNNAAVMYIEPAFNTDASATPDVTAEGSNVFHFSALYATNFSFHPILTTGGSTATIPVELALINPIPWYVPAFEMEAEFFVPARQGTGRVWSLHDGTNENVIEVYYDPDGFRLQVNHDDDNIFNINGGQFTNGTLVNVRVRVRAGDYAISVNGAAEVTNDYAEVPDVDTLQPGNRAGDDRALAGGLKTLTYRPLPA